MFAHRANGEADRAGDVVVVQAGEKFRKLTAGGIRRRTGQLNQEAGCNADWNNIWLQRFFLGELAKNA